MSYYGVDCSQLDSHQGQLSLAIPPHVDININAKGMTAGNACWLNLANCSNYYHLQAECGRPFYFTSAAVNNSCHIIDNEVELCEKIVKQKAGIEIKALDE